jgi:hypothetical protein
VKAWYPFIIGDEGTRDWDDETKVFPTIRRRGPVAIIGCSTSVATPPFSASGYFSPRQARETVNLLRRPAMKACFGSCSSITRRSMALPPRTSG